MSNKIPKKLYALEFPHAIKIGASADPARRAKEIVSALEAVGVICLPTRATMTEAAGYNWRSCELAALDAAGQTMQRIGNREWFVGSWGAAIDAIRSQQLCGTRPAPEVVPAQEALDRPSRGTIHFLRHRMKECGMSQEAISACDVIFKRFSADLDANDIRIVDLSRPGLSHRDVILQMRKSGLFLISSPSRGQTISVTATIYAGVEQ